MPISGVVITCRPADKDAVLSVLRKIPEVDVYGDDNNGNIVAVIDTGSSEEMERVIDRINTEDRVFHVGLTYLNTEDEADRMMQGERLAKPFGFRKPLLGDR